MNEKIFHLSVGLVALAFTAYFSLTIVPALIENPDILAAFAAGYVNPFAAGYSTDAALSWVVLLFWVIYEAKSLGIRHGWICVLLGVIPGIAVGFALYLIIRSRQIDTKASAQL